MGFLTRSIAATLICCLLNACHDDNGDVNTLPSEQSHGIVFVAKDFNVINSFRLYRTDLDGGHLEQISSPGISYSINEFKISTDGHFVAYKVINTGDLWVTDLKTESEGRFDNSRTRNLGNTNEYEWSTSGSRLLFTQSGSGVDADQRLFLFDPSSQDLNQLTDNGSISGISWSPSVAAVAFLRIFNADHSTTQLVSLNLSSLSFSIISEPLQAGESLFNDGYIWSQSGDYIAYIVGEAGAGDQLHTNNENGSDHRLIADNFVGVLGTVKWSTIEERLLFLDDPLYDDIINLYSSKFDGSDRAKISNIANTALLGVGGGEWTNEDNIIFVQYKEDGTSGFTEERYLTDALGIHRLDMRLPGTEDMYSSAISSSPDGNTIAILMTAVEIEPEPSIQLFSSKGDWKNTIESTVARKIWNFSPIWSDSSDRFVYRAFNETNGQSILAISDTLGNIQFEIPADIHSGVNYYSFGNVLWGKDNKHLVFQAETIGGSNIISIQSVNLENSSVNTVSSNLEVSVTFDVY